MNYQILTAIIAALSALSVATVSFFLNESAKRRAEWQQKKFAHYQGLLLAISALAIDNGTKRDVNKYRANQDFSTASNTIALIASQDVVGALMNFHNEIKFSNKENFSSKRHDKLLLELILAIRKDIGLSKKDDSTSFDFHLIGSQPKV